MSTEAPQFVQINPDTLERLKAKAAVYDHLCADVDCVPVVVDRCALDRLRRDSLAYREALGQLAMARFIAAALLMAMAILSIWR